MVMAGVVMADVVVVVARGLGVRGGRVVEAPLE